jgi:hypothetical protein
MTIAFRRQLILLALVGFLWPGIGDAKAIPDKVQDILSHYCFDCHGDGSSKGKVDLDRPAAELFADHGVWERVWSNLRRETMPPAKKEQPTAEERQIIADFVARDIFNLDPTKPDPGRVTIRRLNAREYRYTIKDVLDLDFNAKYTFLPDDTGYGFDTIGDTLSLPPAQMDKYFNAAEWIVEQVTEDTRLRFSEYNISDKRDSKKDGKHSHSGRFEVPKDGTYRLVLDVRIGQSWSRYHGNVPVTLEIGDKTILEERWREEGLEDSGNLVIKRVETEITLEKGKHDALLVYDLESGRDAKDTEPSAFSIRAFHVAGPIKPPVLVRNERYKRVFYQGLPDSMRQQTAPGSTARAGQLGYARRILQRLGGRAFRRPPEAATIDAFMTIVEGGLDNGLVFEKAVGEAILAIFVSPRFLFRAEVQPLPDDPGRVHRLDDYALASRLSYFLWSSVPDDTLRKVADAGKLHDELAKESQRMVKDKRFDRFINAFVGQWLQTDNLVSRHFGSGYRESMGSVRRYLDDETRQYVAHIIRDDRPLLELIDSDYAFLNEPLATHYGLPAVKGKHLRKVSLVKDSPRGGVLTQGAFLAVTSNPTRSSPVKRGLFVLENVLGAPPPPPPDIVPALEEARKDDAKPKSFSEMLAIHRQDKQCASCHNRMDPIGLGLEQFDPVGRWRTHYPTLPKELFEEPDPRDRQQRKDRRSAIKEAVDESRGKNPTGVVIESAGTLDSGEAFSGPAELKVLLAARSRHFYRCLTEKIMIYALGRGLNVGDVPTIEGIIDNLEKEPRFSVLLEGIVTSPQFTMRRGNGVKTRQ